MCLHDNMYTHTHMPYNKTSGSQPKGRYQRMRLVFFVAAVLALLVILEGAEAAAPRNLTQDTCSRCARTDPNINYRFCVASLEAAPDSQCAHNLRQLGSLSLKLTRFNVSHTAHHVRILLQTNYSKDPYVISCLKDCFDLYYDAIPTVKEAIRDYRFKRYDDANIKLSAVMDASSTCEDGFKDKPGTVSPLTSRNYDVFQLTAINLSITNMLRPGSLG